MRRTEAESLMKKLKETACPARSVRIDKAKEIIGEANYVKLLKEWGPAKRGSDCLVYEKGSYLWITTSVERKLRSIEEASKPATTEELEDLRRFSRFNKLSLILSVLVAGFFFSIGALPGSIPVRCARLVYIKIGLGGAGLVLIFYLHHKLFQFLEKLRT